MARGIIPTQLEDKAELQHLWDMVHKRVQGKIDEQLDELIKELDKIK